MSLSALFLTSTMEVALARTLEFEGFHSCPYRDAHGWSVGYGQWLGPSKKGVACVTLESATAWSEARYGYNHNKLVKALSWFTKAPTNVQVVMLDMSYNLGVDNFLKWTKTLAKLKRGKYCQAAALIRKTKYARQTGRRAVSNANLLCPS